MHPVTSHDVARLAGVSQPTVSRALRDRRGVSVQTRQKVRDAAKALGYVTSQAGRTLATRTTGRVGVVSAELSNPFYPALLEPLHDRLAEAGFRTILVTDRGDAPVEVEPLIDGSLDGVVVTTALLDSPLPAELARRGMPLVLLNRTVADAAADSCCADNRGGAAAAADLLVDLGHRRIAAVLGPRETSTGFERGEGFTGRLALRGLAPILLRHGPFHPSTGRASLPALLEAGATAVFCGNDVIALGLLDAARAAGVGVPGDLSVVGFDDVPMAGWDSFALTTLHTDLPALAEGAVGLLLDRLRDPQAPPRRLDLPVIPVLRATHAAPRASRTASRAAASPARTAPSR